MDIFSNGGNNFFKKYLEFSNISEKNGWLRTEEIHKICNFRFSRTISGLDLFLIEKHRLQRFLRTIAQSDQ